MKNGKNEYEKTEVKESILHKVMTGLLIGTLIIVLFNVTQITQLKSQVGTITLNTNSEITQMKNGMTPSMSDNMPNIKEGIDVIPKGIPKIYGGELGISYDDISASDPKKADEGIKKLGSLDEQINLNGKDLERYILVVSKISCEYCCGADSIITNDGKPSCGCAHSFAMRGLAKYLIKYHNSEVTDDEILEELGKWKTLFFPGKIKQKAGILKEKSIELSYINLASNKYRGIEKEKGSGEMVGGC